MTLLSRQPGLAAARPQRVQTARRSRTVLLRWEVSRAALCASRSDLVRDAKSAAPVLLEWRVALDESGGLDGLASVIEPRRGEADRVTPLLSTRGVLFGADGQPTWIDDGAMVHVDIPGLLMVSLRKAAAGDVLLYARTSVLGVLGLPGGRYESGVLVL